MSKEARAERSKRYYEANKEKVKARNKAYRQKHGDAGTRSKSGLKAKRERKLLRYKTSETHHEQCRKNTKAWRDAHPEEAAAISSKSGRVWRSKLKAEVIATYGGKCQCCGESEIEFLTIDHINGGGNEHRKEIGKSGSPFHEWLRKNNYPDGFRCLCFNCNFSASRGNGVCIHQRSHESLCKPLREELSGTLVETLE